tara:strand:- start:22 stop:333 length:312 start_codon:yes stop_codon:yes gene_type:complete
VPFSDRLGLLEVVGIRNERAAGAIFFKNSSQNWSFSMEKHSFPKHFRAFPTVKANQNLKIFAVSGKAPPSFQNLKKKGGLFLRSSDPKKIRAFGAIFDNFTVF